MKIEVLEVLKVNANPWDLTDQDKIIATIKIDGQEQKVVMPDEDIESEKEFNAFISKVAQKVIAQVEKPRVINLSKKWQGKYEVKNAI